MILLWTEKPQSCCTSVWKLRAGGATPLDELINAMEPQARKDKALISKCVDGLTEYAAELRQKAGDAGKEQISALRRLVDELAG